MLSELFHISKNLMKSDLAPRLVHVDFGEPGLSTYQNLRLLISDKGTILNIEVLKPDYSGELWTLKKGNFKFFPAIRISDPLLTVAPDDPSRSTLKKDSATGLLKLLQERGDNPHHYVFAAEREQAKRILSWSNDESANASLLRSFAESFLSLSSDPTNFADELKKAISKALRLPGDEKTLKVFQSLICGSLKESKGKPAEVETKVQLIIDYLPAGAVQGELFNAALKRTVLEGLNRETKSDASGSRGKNNERSEFPPCAFTGKQTPLLTGPYADWSAKPVMGKPFKPYSKFSDANCNYRYRRADSEGFPIGTETAKALVSAGCDITSTEWRGKTWRELRNGRFEEQGGKKKETFDLLIVYPTFPWEELIPVNIFAKPDAGKKAADLNTDEDGVDESTNASTDFTRVAEEYCRTLKETVSLDSLDRGYIRVLLLRQISPGQVQLVYNDSPKREHFVNSIQEWMQSLKGLPPRLKVLLPSAKRESGIGWFAPRLLFPEEAIRLYSHQWMRGGTESTRIQSPPVGDILNVFLRKEGVWKSTALRLLEILLSRVEPLLTGAGNVLHRLDYKAPTTWKEFVPKASDGSRDKRKPDPRYYLAQAISLMGSLLYSLNSKSEIYMSQTAFLTGRLLAIMDELHRRYCICERGGDIPPTLIGNGLLGRAADAPLLALGELCERSRIYIGWARSTEPSRIEKEASRFAALGAKKLLNLAQPICSDLHEHEELSHPMDATGKAHLLLGYLSPVFPEKADGEKTGGSPPESGDYDKQSNQTE